MPDRGEYRHSKLNSYSLDSGMNMNSLPVGPTMESRWKFYKTKKEANEGEGGEDVVGWGRHLVCGPVTDEGDVVAFFSTRSSLSR